MAERSNVSSTQGWKKPAKETHSRNVNKNSGLSLDDIHLEDFPEDEEYSQDIADMAGYTGASVIASRVRRMEEREEAIREALAAAGDPEDRVNRPSGDMEEISIEEIDLSDIEPAPNAAKPAEQTKLFSRDSVNAARMEAAGSADETQLIAREEVEELLEEPDPNGGSTQIFTADEARELRDRSREKELPQKEAAAAPEREGVRKDSSRPAGAARYKAEKTSGKQSSGKSGTSGKKESTGRSSGSSSGSSSRKNSENAKLVRTRKIRKFIICLIIWLIVIALCLIAFFAGYQIFYDVPVDESDLSKISVTITGQETDEEMAQILLDHDLIADGRIYRVRALLYDAKYKSGTYKLSRSYNTEKLVNMLSGFKYSNGTMEEDETAGAETTEAETTEAETETNE